MDDAEVVQRHQGAGDVCGVEGGALLGHAARERLDERKEVAAEGRVSIATVEQAAADRCRALFGTVAGPGDPLWTLHTDTARQAIALGAFTAAELSEWVAVLRQREGRSR